MREYGNVSICMCMYLCVCVCVGRMCDVCVCPPTLTWSQSPRQVEPMPTVPGSPGPTESSSQSNFYEQTYISFTSSTNLLKSVFGFHRNGPRNKADAEKDFSQLIVFGCFLVLRSGPYLVLLRCHYAWLNVGVHSWWLFGNYMVPGIELM